MRLPKASLRNENTRCTWVSLQSLSNKMPLEERDSLEARHLVHAPTDPSLPTTPLLEPLYDAVRHLHR